MKNMPSNIELPETFKVIKNGNIGQCTFDGNSIHVEWLSGDSLSTNYYDYQIFFDQTEMVFDA